MTKKELFCIISFTGCLVIGIITFLGMFDGVEYSGAIEFRTFYVLALVLAATLAVYVTTFVPKPQGGKKKIRLIMKLLFALLIVCLLFAYSWMITLLFFIK